MKKILILLLFVTQICNAQLHIGKRLTLRDSSNYAVLNGELKTWATNWLMTKDLDSSIAGSGINFNNNNGLSVNVSNGIYIENDTLKLSTFTRTYNDSIAIVKINSNPTLRFTNINSNIAYIKLNEQNLLSFSPNNVTSIGDLNALADMYSGRDIYALSNFKIGDANASETVIDIQRNIYGKDIYSNELHTNDTTNAIALYIDSDVSNNNTFDGGGFTPSSESYFGDGTALMTTPSTWIVIKMDNVDYLVPMYLP